MRPAPRHQAHGSCSVCHAPDYTTCPCPWGKAFDKWPSGLLGHVAKVTGGGPHPGS